MIPAGQTIVSIIFRLVNFGVLIALMVYIFRTYALEAIKKKLAAREFFQAELRAQTCRFEEKKAEELQQSSHDRILFESLSQKVLLWEQAIKNERLARESMCEKRAIELHHRMVQRAEQIFQERATRELLPAAFKAAERHIVQQFEDVQERKKFLSKSLERAQKVTS